MSEAPPKGDPAPAADAAERWLNALLTYGDRASSGAVRRLGGALAGERERAEAATEPVSAG